jgi:hypothetical protein
MAISYSIYSFMCMFCSSLLVRLSFSFGHCVVCLSIYGFGLPLWYLQTLLTSRLFDSSYTNQRTSLIYYSAVLPPIVDNT